LRTVCHGLFDAGVEAAGSFIVGQPGESASSIEDTFRLALILPLGESQRALAAATHRRDPAGVRREGVAKEYRARSVTD
jgi:hypothetical protein